MDQRGIEWCKGNVELIVDWLKKEARKRRLPFSRVIGRMLVKRSIKNAERKEKARQHENGLCLSR